MQRSDEAERSTDELLAEVESLTDDGGRDPASDAETAPGDASTAEAAEREGRGGGLRSRLPSFSLGSGGRVFSVRSFLAVLLLSVGGLFVGSAIPVIGILGQFAGLFAVAFAVGLVGSRRRYAEVGLAGALAAGLGFVVSALTTAFFPFAVRLLADYGVAVAGVGAGAGLLVALAGHYFGRDLRAGLTRDV